MQLFLRIMETQILNVFIKSKTLGYIFREVTAITATPQEK